MLFNSLHFMAFFPIVVAVYFALPHRFRWLMLLAASYYFYMCWRVAYIVLILASTLVDYVAARGIEASRTRKGRILWLLMSLILNFGLLFSFKYFNFVNANLRLLFEQFGFAYEVAPLNVLLPVGISFYTFQTLSYTIDVFLGGRKAERHLGMFALYVAFFPQLVAGPIERSTSLLPQFYEKHEFDHGRLRSGLLLMAWGFFKKVVVADSLAIYVNAVYNHPADHDGLKVLIATYFFAFQIFCDFSGYSDIAIGAARIMGFELMENFRRPYHARSIGDFWKRWHISLSTWFRDYLYIPLGGNRVGPGRWRFNLFIVFLLSGLWHGANWTFVVWGALHGAYLVIGVLTQGWRDRLASRLLPQRLTWVRDMASMFITFHLVLLGWVFFRANSLSDAIILLARIAGGGDGLQTGVLGPMTVFEFTVAVLGIVAVESVHFAQAQGISGKHVFSLPLPLRWAVYYVLVFATILFANIEPQQFIYFQF